MEDEEGPVYEEVPFTDMELDESTQTYTYACPCGDRFTISLDELREGEEIAPCNDCSLVIRVLIDDATRASLGAGCGANALREERQGTPVPAV